MSDALSCTVICFVAGHICLPVYCVVCVHSTRNLCKPVRLESRAEQSCYASSGSVYRPTQQRGSRWTPDDARPVPNPPHPPSPRKAAEGWKRYVMDRINKTDSPYLENSESGAQGQGEWKRCVLYVRHPTWHVQPLIFWSCASVSRKIPAAFAAYTQSRLFLVKFNYKQTSTRHVIRHKKTLSVHTGVRL